MVFANHRFRQNGRRRLLFDEEQRKALYGNPYTRFGEGGRANVTMAGPLRHRQTKRAALDRLNPRRRHFRNIYYRSNAPFLRRKIYA